MGLPQRLSRGSTRAWGLRISWVNRRRALAKGRGNAVGAGIAGAHHHHVLPGGGEDRIRLPAQQGPGGGLQIGQGVDTPGTSPAWGKVRGSVAPQHRSTAS